MTRAERLDVHESVAVLARPFLCGRDERTAIATISQAASLVLRSETKATIASPDLQASMSMRYAVAT
jgi:hypothetical protein